jgi:hypothetical protein
VSRFLVSNTGFGKVPLERMHSSSIAIGVGTCTSTFKGKSPAKEGLCVVVGPVYRGRDEIRRLSSSRGFFKSFFLCS